jgi:membrane protease YdiL (CAAX protease family)
MASTSTQQAIASVSHAETAPEISRQRRLEDLGLIMLVGFLPLVISAVYLLLVPVQFNAAYANYGFSGGLIREFAVLILFICLLRRQGRGLQTVGLTFQWTDLPKGFGLFLLSYLGSYFALWCAQSAFYFWNQRYFSFRGSTQVYASASGFLFFVYYVAAPFFEETLVRGYLMTELIGVSCPVWIATAASIVLQTTYHLYYGVAGALYLGFGFAISSIYFARSRKLVPVILSHLLWDLTAMYPSWHR